jgi:ribosomal protein L7/L12
MKIGRLTIEFNISWDGSYMSRVKRALRKGFKLSAIKIYKDATGLGLKESKDTVDKLCPKYLKKSPEKASDSSNIFEIEDLAKFQAKQFNK